MGDLQKTNSQVDIVEQESQEVYSIGHYGRLHRDYLKSHWPVLYLAMLQRVRLWAYLAELDRQAHFFVGQMAAQEGVTEALKAHKRDGGASLNPIQGIKVRLSAEDFSLVEQLLEQDLTAHSMECECHFRFGFSAGLVLLQETYQELQRSMFNP